MVGREREIAALEEAATRKDAQFIAIYGRRRVGKTYLVRETFKDRFCFCHTGVAREGTSNQLLYFRDSLVKYGHASCPALKTWREAFLELEKLLDASSMEKKILFIDELPWIDKPKSNFVSALEHFWNAYASARPDILLVVCGSATSWMINTLLKDHGGLHNRVTNKIHLKPFSLHECEDYAAELGLAFSREEICLGYMVFGGIPFYWSLMSRRLSLRQNIDALLFSEDAKLRNEFTELFDSLFKNGTMYRHIVTAMASIGSGMPRESIIAKAKLPDSGNVTKCLEDLESSGFIRKYTALGKKKKDSIYQLTDNFSFFHLKFIADKPNADESFWSNSIGSARQSAWSGIAFERVCLHHIRQIKNALQIGGVQTNVYSWRHTPDETYPIGAQIDLLIDRADGIIDICEMKYTKDNYNATEKSDEDMRRRMSIFSDISKTRKSIRAVLITPYGLTQNKYSGRFSNVITFDDLFK